MSHELEIVEGKANFAFNGDAGLPWHGLGVKMDGQQTAEVMLETANADYEVDLRPVFVEDERTGEFVEIPNRFATARINPFTDVLQPFEVFRGRYALMQNSWVLDKALAVVGASNGDAVIDTLGVMFDGAQFFASIDLGTLVIDPAGVNDTIARYLMVKTSHDGSSPLVYANTDIRVVCNNTCRFGEQVAKSVFKARHTPNAEARIDEAQKVLGFSTAWTEAFETQANELLAIEIPKLSKRVDIVLDAIYPEKDADTDRKKANRDEQVTKVRMAYGNSRNGERVGYNGWGLYNAFTEVLDWHGKGTREKMAIASLDETGIVTRRKVQVQDAILSLV